MAFIDKTAFCKRGESDRGRERLKKSGVIILFF